MKNQWLLKLDQKSNQLLNEIGQLAADLGFKAYLVGGPVRDLVLGHAQVDLDIVVEGNGIRLAENFAQQHKTEQIVKYPAFKTATVALSKKLVVDFATARKESYARGGVFPKVEPAPIKADLYRRDFTINAIAISINPSDWGRVVDPFNGMDDLKKKKIRILHSKSFLDDPTRILRAARFMNRFGFKIEEKTRVALENSIEAGALDTIKPQRYKKEFDKIQKEKKSKEMIQCLKMWNAYRENK